MSAWHIRPSSTFWLLHSLRSQQTRKWWAFQATLFLWYWAWSRCDPFRLFSFVVCFLDQLLRPTVIQIRPRHPPASLGWLCMIIYHIKRSRPSNVCSYSLSLMRRPLMSDGKQSILFAIYRTKAWCAVDHGMLCKPRLSVWSSLKGHHRRHKTGVQRWERALSGYSLVVRI